MSTTQEFAYLKHLVVLCGLLHDLGKASTAFQRKLKRRAVRADPVRHELLSVGLVLAAVERACPGLRDVSDPDARVLSFLSSPGFGKAVDEALRFGGVGTWVARMLDQARLVMPRVPTHGRVLTDVCQVILVHHRLSDCQSGEPLTLTPWAYLDGGVSCDVAAVLAGCSFAGRVKDFGEPADCAAWSESVARTAKALLASLSGGRPPPMPPGTIQHHARLALMVGDHHASAVGSGVARAPAVRGRLYANAPREGEVGEMGQSLARHLVSVARASAVAASALNRRLDGFPRLTGEAIPEEIVCPSRTGRYGWQGEAVAAIRAAREGGARGGCLAFVMASTGSGKTRAVPSIVLASRCDEGLRYSVGLGLRSLTLQTAREYTTGLGFHGEGVSVAIGSSLMRKLERLKRRLDAQEAAEKDSSEIAVVSGDPVGDEDEIEVLAPGVSSEREHLGDVESLAGEAPVLELPALAWRMNAASSNSDQRRVNAARRFLAAPILVSTLDQVMPVATSTRGGHLTAALRTATSDLVIDEIDDFAPEEVCAICRLVEHAASHGRHVVIASATLPPPVASAVYKAYRAGWSRHAALTGTCDRFDVAWAGDAPGACRVASPEPHEFDTCHGEVAAAVAADALARPWKRRIAYAPCGDVGDVPGYHGVVRGGIVRLHRDHHAVDEATGRRVSAGVVRWANVRPALEFAHGLLEHGIAGYDVVVVPYVGTLLPAVRFRVETVLDRLLTRKAASDPLLAAGSPVRDRIDRALTRDVLVVVVTTSLEETGRDHDFDWAVTEPLSARGLVQLAGRVRRHRNPPRSNTPPNLLVLERALKSIEHPGHSRPFSKPGVETAWRNAYGIETGTGALPSHEASAILQGEGWEERVSAASLVAPERPRSILAAYERSRWSTILHEAGDGLGPVRRHDNEFLSQAHPRWRRFRRQQGPAMELSLRDGTWCLLSPAGLAIRVQDRVRMLRVADESRLLVPVSDLGAVERLADDLLAQMAQGDASTRNDLLTVTLTGIAGSERWGMDWHPALGSYLRIG